MYVWFPGLFIEHPKRRGITSYTIVAMLPCHKPSFTVASQREGAPTFQNGFIESEKIF